MRDLQGKQQLRVYALVCASILASSSACRFPSVSGESFGLQQVAIEGLTDPDSDGEPNGTFSTSGCGTGGVQPDEEPESIPVISPSISILASGGSSTLSVSGGEPPYCWTIVEEQDGTQEWGSLQLLIDGFANYFAAHNVGSATIRVVDSLGYFAEASVQIAPGTPVSITDPLESQLWHLDQVDTSKGWGISDGSCDGALVAILDTGISWNHPDLFDNIHVNYSEIAGNGLDDDGNGYVDDFYGYNMVGENGEVLDDHYHGTHVSGIVGAVGGNDEGVSGICKRARLMGVKTFDFQGGATTSDIIDGIDFALARGAKVINASWATNDTSHILESKFNQLEAAGVIVVTAAGNNGNEIPGTGAGENIDVNGPIGTPIPYFPAKYPYDNIITVSSSNESDLKSNFSNWGPFSSDVMAPGNQVLSTTPMVATSAMNAFGVVAEYSKESGTSMATPIVAGIVAQVWTAYPWYTYHQVRDAVLNSVDPLPSSQTGLVTTDGRVNLFNALNQ